jgi:hypothetical protein
MSTDRRESVRGNKSDKRITESKAQQKESTTSNASTAFSCKKFLIKKMILLSMK